MIITSISHDKKNNRIVFSLKGVDVSFANAMRRCAMEEVRTMAIEDVEIRKNSSALYDEMLALRLGLVPLTTDLKSYKLLEEGEEPSARTQLSLTLKAAGPGSVYASQIESADPKVKPVIRELLIAKLLKGQKIELEAKAMLGRGKDHAKWSPGLVFYRNKQTVKLGAVRDVQEVLRVAPAGVFQEKGGKLSVDEAKLNSIDIAGTMEGVDGVTVEEDPSEFIFTVESWGQLSCRDIMLEAANEFEAQLKELDGLLKE